MLDDPSPRQLTEARRRQRPLPVYDNSLRRAACRDDASLAARRDTAAILLLYGGGLRRGELPELEPSDWDGANRAVRVRQGKGNKEREVFVAHSTAQPLDEWVRARRDRPVKLFLPTNKGGSVSG